MPFPPVAEQLELICRGVEKIVPEEELAARLEHSRRTNTPLRVKYGIDPTGVDLHLGHTVPMRKMRQFQELGHQAVVIIGNYTALVGDPSGRDQTRTRLTAEQVEANARDYLEQVGRVLDLSNAEVVRNGDWFGKMTFAELLELCGKVTVAQLLTRDDFSKRFKEENPIYLHECLYPVMQAWDSVIVRADIELGGTEQLYSFMLARDLQKQQGLAPQIGVMSPILVGLDGVRRMGKSLGNYIGIAEAPYEMMKKFMQLPDDCMRSYYELLTDLPEQEVESLLSGHPKFAKMTLGQMVICEIHGLDAAEEAGNRWQKEIGEGGLPAEIPERMLSRSKLADGSIAAAELLVELQLSPSKSEARRLIAQGGAKLGEDRRPIGAFDERIAVVDGLLVWAGKKKLCRARLAD
ncbi:MAG: tyrosine--tRNA ligase [Planctomycetaceae bacterium]